MDFYLVGPEKKSTLQTIINRHPTNLLFSYLSKREAMKWFKAIKPAGKMFIDSGAFTVWNKGATLNTDQYIEWLNANVNDIDLFGQVDSIPGVRFKVPTPEQVKEAAAKTWENYLYMRERVINKDGLLYTFHIGEPLEYLKRALAWKDEKGNPIKYMALGGMVSRPYEDRDKFLDLAYHIIKSSENPNIKVHTFGMTDYKLLQKYPITSADSTSWIMTGVMGGIMFEEGVVKVSEVGKNSKDFYLHKMPAGALETIQKYLDKYGFNLKDLESDTDKRKLYNAYFMQDRMDSIQQVYKKVNRLF